MSAGAGDGLKVAGDNHASTGNPPYSVLPYWLWVDRRGRCVPQLFRPDLQNPGPDDLKVAAQFMHVLPIGWVEPVDISNAVLFLASDESRYITGLPVTVDAGSMLK